MSGEDSAITNLRLLEELIGVKTLCGQQAQSMARVEQRLGDHEDRLRVLEPTGQASASQQVTLSDHEERLRLADKWRYALPPTMILSAIALILSALQLAGKG